MIVLKIILWIILALLLLVVLALCLPLRICVKYKDSVAVTVKYLFLSIPIVPKKEKKKTQKSNAKKMGEKTDKRVDTQETDPKKKSTVPNKQSAKTDSEKEEDENTNIVSQIKDLYKQKGLDGLITVIKELGGLVTGTLKKVFKRIKLRKFELDIAVSEENAADTAVKYGYVCAVVYPVVSLILNSVKFNDYSIDIAPNFDKKESEINLYAEISIIPWFGVIYAVSVFINFIKLKVKGIL